jgi:hypothetical protein
MDGVIIQPQTRVRDRREFVRDLLWAGGAGLSILAVGCDVRNLGSVQRAADGSEQTVIMKDLFVLRFTTDPGKPVEVLPVQNIANGLPTTFLWSEKTHSHSYTIDALHYERLKRGETIVVTSTITNGHTHSFMIDPKVVVESSSALKVPLRDLSEGSALEPTTLENLLKLIS